MKQRTINEISLSLSLTASRVNQLVPNLFSFFFYRTCTQSIQRTSDITELDVSKRCKNLASFMESLLQETKMPGVNEDKLAVDDENFSVTIS